jgi:carboxypeptidase Taq
MTKKIYACRKSKMPLYDQMLDDFEEGMDMKKYDAFFELLKAKIVPLIKKINSAKKIDDKFLNQKFAIDSQKNFNNVLLEYLDFKKENGYMATSSHPFTMELSIGDVRITTRYNETQLSENIFSVIHEIGHAFFQQQIDKKFEGTPITCAIGSGMHESQSRLLENQIGRSIEF